jgi:hypothetical protein
MKIRQLIHLGARGAAVTAGIVWGVYKGAQQIRAMREAMGDLDRVSDAATAIAEITPLSPREAQDRLDAGMTVEEIKQLVSKQFGEWGAA